MKTAINKCLSCILAISIIISIGCFAVGAVPASYPESQHNYQNNVNQEWSYDYGEEAEGLFVTFSEKTSFEKPTFKYQPIISGPNGEVISGGVMKQTKDGDKLTVKGDNYSLSATGKELAGKTIYVPGNRFVICLESDSSVTDYGFSIDRISDTAPDKVAVVTYDCCEICGEKKKFCYNEGEEIKVGKDYYCTLDDSAFVSWISDDGKEYNEGDSLDFASVNLKAKRVSLLLGGDEVWSFSNSDPYFDPDRNGGYYLTKEDFFTMQKNTYKVFGIGVLPALGLSIALATYPEWYWNGSCYGMSTTTLLQHSGDIDILKNRSEKSLSELTNEDDILSFINYYQWSAAGSFLCENFSWDKGSEMYSQQLRNIFESVSDGNIVMFTYYPGETFKTSGHTVLLTGAYTQKDGSKVLVAYDCNHAEDYTSKAFEQRFYIDKDFTTIKRGQNYPCNWFTECGEYNWTDDTEHFEAFNINGRGRVSGWYAHFFSQMGNLIKTLFSLM